MGYPRICLECKSRVCEHLRKPPHLAPREVKLLVLLAGGLSNKEIATESGLTEGTVKTYLRSMFSKMKVATRLEAALWAVYNRELLSGLAAEEKGSALE